jgi:hypothetical protein
VHFILVQGILPIGFLVQQRRGLYIKFFYGASPEWVTQFNKEKHYMPYINKG